MADVTVKKGDVKPIFGPFVVTNSAGVVVDLTGASVKFVMRSLTATAPAVNTAATIVTPSAGTVQYTPTAQDTATAGQYQGEFHVTFGDASTLTWPTAGYVEISVEEDLITQTQVGRLVGLGEVRDHLNFGADRTHDAELLRLVDAITPVVEFITGPVVQRSYTETYDGGSSFISLRHRPIVSVASVAEFRGPIRYELTQVASPDLGTIYSYEFEASGRIVRRTVGGGMTSFPGGLETVTVTYTAGYVTVPANIRYGCLELIRVNYQQTQQAGHPMFGGGGGDDAVPGAVLMGFFVPNRVKELLLPSKRHPSIV